MAIFERDLSILEKLESLFAEKQSKFVFETCRDRVLYPSDIPKNRVGNQMNPIRGPPEIGPGTYETDKVTSLVGVLNQRTCSTKGYTLGARTAPKFSQGYQDATPDPAQYQGDWARPIKFTPNYRPFLEGSERFPARRSDLGGTPGVGAYDPQFGRNHRHVTWQQAFNSGPINLPDVTQKSTIIRNTDKLMTTKEDRKYQRKLAYLKLYYD